MKFGEVGLDKSLLKAVKRSGFEEATPIQAETIPLVLAGNDVIGQAQTGTGKTAAFGLPVLQQLDLDLRQISKFFLLKTIETEMVLRVITIHSASINFQPLLRLLSHHKFTLDWHSMLKLIHLQRFPNEFRD